MARDNFAVIFITESVAKDMEETLERYEYPAIILIPGNQGSLGLRIQEIKERGEGHRRRYPVWE